MRKHCILTIFIFLEFFCSAQKDTLHKRGVEPGIISINAGLGASTMVWAQTGAPIGPGDYSTNVVSVSPAYNFSIDYNVTRRSSFGVAVTYQKCIINPGYGDITLNADTCYYARLNIAIRYCEHLSKSSKHDAYWGLRSGVSFWTIKEVPPGIPISTGQTTYTPRQTLFSIQLLFGYRTYLNTYNGHLALQFEAGIGTPYFLEVGLAYRIFTQKK